MTQFYGKFTHDMSNRWDTSSKMRYGDRL